MGLNCKHQNSRSLIRRLRLMKQSPTILLFYQSNVMNDVCYRYPGQSVHSSLRLYILLSISCTFLLFERKASYLKIFLSRRQHWHFAWQTQKQEEYPVSQSVIQSCHIEHLFSSISPSQKKQSSHERWSSLNLWG